MEAGKHVLCEKRAVQAALAKQFLASAGLRNDSARGGGALYDLGSHALSACNAEFGKPPRRVIAAVDATWTGGSTG